MSLTLNQSLNLYLTWNLDWYLHPDPKWRPWLQNSTPAIPCNDIIACLSYFRTLIGSCFRIGFSNVISIRLILLITSGAQQTRVCACACACVCACVRVFVWYEYFGARQSWWCVCVSVGKCVCVLWIFLQSRPGAKSTNLQSISFLSITEFTHWLFTRDLNASFQGRRGESARFYLASSLHWLNLLSNSSFLYNWVYWVNLMLSICEVIVSQKTYNGE